MQDKIARDSSIVPARSSRFAPGSFVSAINKPPHTTKAAAIGRLIKNSQCHDPVTSSKKLPIFGPRTAAIPFIAPKSPRAFPCFSFGSTASTCELPIIKIPPPPSA
ncbi:hypothetical protein MUS_0863 [Bacillus velezensis YAU B9601-Y2]|uniref:Uncharacterized protein n=1 Tax=Bacillus amyloliquefaciens (strain Y2) TaxID=1155777 RepID=I2C2N5_BACAY|nr:hypothetical protein MUS_0863 [Bacillus velezensis YAU B9601-Y2]